MAWTCWYWSDLGKSSTLLVTDLDCGNTMLWLFYWKDIDHLRVFAHEDAHRAGWDWYNAFKGHSHIGIMHEIYSAPKGNWENIYHNFRPFGMGNAFPRFSNDNLLNTKLTLAKGKQSTSSKIRKRRGDMVAVSSLALCRTRRTQPENSWQQGWGGLRGHRESYEHWEWCPGTPAMTRALFSLGLLWALLVAHCNITAQWQSDI